MRRLPNHEVSLGEFLPQFFLPFECSAPPSPGTMSVVRRVCRGWVYHMAVETFLPLRRLFSYRGTYRSSPRYQSPLWITRHPNRVNKVVG